MIQKIPLVKDAYIIMHVKKFLSLPFLFFSFSAFAYTDPYRVLGITRNASKREIESACKKQMKKTHPDKGGNTESFIQVTEACASLKGDNSKQKDAQCTRLFKTCSCSPSKNGFCNISFSKEGFRFYCDCEGSSSGQEDFQDTSFDREETTFSSQGAHDRFNTFKEEFFRSFNSDWSDFFTDTRYEGSFYFLSRTVQSPVFNIAVEESLRPSPLEEGPYFSGEFTVAPFAHFEKVDFFNGFYKQREEGVLVRGYSRFLGIDFDYVFSLSQKRNHFSLSPADEEPLAFITLDQTHIGLSDMLWGIGRIVKAPFGWIGLKGIFGISGLRKDLSTKDSFLNVPHTSAGLRADAVFPLTFNGQFKHTFHTALRWLHFFGTPLYLKDFSARHIADFKIEPGDYVDLLITFDTVFDSCQKHHLALSYNPTFIIRDEDQSTIIESKHATVKVHDLSLSKTLHTFAFTYTYDSSIYDKPFSCTLGYSGRFALSSASKKINHQNSSVFWVAFALAL